MINLARRLMLGALAFTATRVDGTTGQSSGTIADVARRAAVDSAGNIVAVGISGSVPGFVAKFAPGFGSPTWQRKQTLTASFLTALVGVDSSDNIYAFGGGFVAASPRLPHLFKYDGSGAIQWQRKLTDVDSFTSGLAVNASGDSFLSLVVAGASPVYGLVAKYNASGTIQWQRKMSGTYEVSFRAVALCPDGGIIAAGHMYDGGAASTNARGIVVKYNASGAIQWQSKIHFSVECQYRSVSVDQSTGDILVSGYVTSGGNIKGLIVKLNSAGTVQWHKISPTSSSIFDAIAVDSATGDVFAHLTVGSVVTKFDDAGTAEWRRAFAGSSGVISDPSLTVTPTHLLVVGGIQKTSQGNNAVVLRLPKDGGGNTGTYDHVTITAPAADNYTTGSITSAAAGLTDAAGTHTDAAGTAVDAAQTLTFTNL